MKIIRSIAPIALLLSSALVATGCDDAKKDAAAEDKKEAMKADDKDNKKDGAEEGEKAEDKEAKAEDAPACDKVVDHIASFNDEAGDAEKKLWGKMCDGMSAEEKTCVSKSKDMDGMKACMKDKKLEK